MLRRSNFPPTVAARLWERYAEPDGCCLYCKAVDGDYAEISYHRFFRHAAGFRAAYRAAGVRAGDIVLIIHDHGPELLYAFAGAILAGAIPSILPIPSAKITAEYYTYVIDNLTKVIAPALIVTGPGGLNGVTVSFPILTSDSMAPDPSPAPDPSLALSPDDIVLLQHSSGTTGLQKGVALTHRAMFAQLSAYAEAIALDEHDVIASWLPLYHDMGLIACCVLPLMTGTPFSMMSPFEWISRPVELPRMVARYRATLCWLPNFAYDVMTRTIRDEDLPAQAFATLRAAISCSEPVSEATLARFTARFAAHGFRREAASACYAMAENTFAVTQTPPGQYPHVIAVDPQAYAAGEAVPAAPGAPARHCVSSGRALAGCEVRIAGPHGRILPDGGVGEIIIRSPCLLKEYFRRPDASAKAIRHGWYHTGDTGFLRDGELFVAGRTKDIIIVGGQNYHPHDIETVVGHLAGIRPGRVACIGSTNTILDTEELAVVAELREAADTARCRELIRAIKQEVAATVGARVTRVALAAPGTLQKSTSGKLARAAIRECFLRGEFA